MLLSTLEELRLFSPSNAIDNLDSLAGFVNSSEADFLKEKLGNELYASLVEYYNAQIRNNTADYIDGMTNGETPPAYARLLYLCQKAVTFDALARAVSVQAISINGAGVNQATADEYKAADQQAIADFKKACTKEAHSAINELLQQLEEWTKKADKERADNIGLVPSSTATSPTPTEEAEIAALWHSSRYFYLATSLIIPSAVVLQEYFNIYDSREKFIQLLPDLRYIQEDLLAPIFGDDLMENLAAYPWQKETIGKDTHTERIIHSMRKIMARYLETRLLNASASGSTSARLETARNEAIKLTDRLTDYLQAHQPDFTGTLELVFRTSPLYVSTTNAQSTTKRFENNASGSVMFVTPGLI